MLASAVACVTLLNGALLVAVDDPPWWQVAPVWLGAVGTILAFLVTYLLFRRGSRDREREQASQVYAWLERDPDEEPLAGRAPAQRLNVRNGSPLPVYNVDVFPRVAGSAVDAGGMPTPSTLLPGGSKQVPWRPTAEQYPARDEQPLLRFDDAAGRRWERIGDDLHRRR
jgi:hypothetical protein